MEKINNRKSNKNKLTLLTISLFIAVTFFTGGQVLAQYKTGSPTPEFALEALDGEVYQLSQFNNKQNHLLLCFVNSDDSTSIGKLQDMISFFENYQPKQSYQIIAIVETSQDKTEEIKEKFLALQESTAIPLLILLDNEGKAEESYKIERYPTILLLRYDLHIKRAYDRFTSRQETSFYQYLSFLFTSQKSTGSSSSGCDDGVCPPPPGY